MRAWLCPLHVMRIVGTTQKLYYTRNTLFQVFPQIRKLHSLFGSIEFRYPTNMAVVTSPMGVT